MLSRICCVFWRAADSAAARSRLIDDISAVMVASTVIIRPPQSTAASVRVLTCCSIEGNEVVRSVHVWP